MGTTLVFDVCLVWFELGLDVLENPCDDGWFLINGIKCIFVSGSSPAVFEGAEFECLIKGGRLLEPRELSFESEVHNYLDTSKFYWLGITDRTEEGK